MEEFLALLGIGGGLLTSEAYDTLGDIGREAVKEQTT